MNMRDSEVIIQEIRNAFGDMPYPGTEYITNDLEGNDLERKQIRKGFSRYENWQDVPCELLLQERDALPLFEPQGFRFYLPAYMLFALEDFTDICVGGWHSASPHRAIERWWNRFGN